MQIIKIVSNNRLSDGRNRIEYRLSSPVTKDVLKALSRGEWICSGRQYLTPSFIVTKPGGMEIQGIMKSPIISVIVEPGMQVGFEDYLIEFLSLIPDSEQPEPWYQHWFDDIRRFFLSR